MAENPMLFVKTRRAVWLAVRKDPKSNIVSVCLSFKGTYDSGHMSTSRRTDHVRLVK